MLDTCSTCGGFLPKQGDGCPHCGERSRWKPAVRAAQIAGGAVAMVTLMACYGGPDDYGDETPVDRACHMALTLDSSGHGSGQTLPVQGEGLQGSCVTGTSSAVYSYSTFLAGAAIGKPGTFSVTWSSDVAVGVYIGNYCNAKKELACEGPALSGKLEYQTDALEPMLILVTTKGDATANYQIDASFTPCGTTDAPCPAK